MSWYIERTLAILFCEVKVPPENSNFVVARKNKVSPEDRTYLDTLTIFRVQEFYEEIKNNYEREMYIG